MKVDSITIRRPDDWHLHVRQGDRMRSVVPFTARQFARAIIMPNTKPFILTVDDAARYRDEILAAVPSGVDFTPLMTLYLQTTTSPKTIRAAKKSGFIHGIKMYPQGATTNSEGGVVRIQDVAEQLGVMEEVDMPLLVHGEVADPACDIFEREPAFYREAFEWVTGKFPKLRIVFEHITTEEAVHWISEASRTLRIGATITPQHLLVNRNYLLSGGIKPHAYCLPILKTEFDRKALVYAATSGDPRFFLGTDSAPHPQHGEAGTAKETACGCAGAYNAHAAVERYLEVFDSVGKMDYLQDFASHFGPKFYELPLNNGKVTFIREAWQAPPSYTFGDSTVVPFMQEVPLQWRMAA